MIKLVRIDYRLLHGQVVFAWTRALDIDHIIVANAKAAADAFITMSLNLAKPAGVTLDIATVEQAAEKLNSGKLDHKKVYSELIKHWITQKLRTVKIQKNSKEYYKYRRKGQDNSARPSI